MNNYIYILSDEPSVQVEKFHICTWYFASNDVAVELGVQIASSQELPNEFNLVIHAGFIDSSSKARSLHRELSDAQNFRLIFNEKLLSTAPINQGRNGHIITCSGQNGDINMAIIKADPTIEEENISVRIAKPEGNYSHIYFRLYISTSEEKLVIKKNGISKALYIYDFKINENRNRPEQVDEYAEAHNLSTCPVNAAYCLHCVPSNHEIVQTDNSKLRSIRILEKEAFENYLDRLKNSAQTYLITFQKVDDGRPFSFFTSFTQERIGNQQIVLAVLLNILCSFVFSILPENWQEKVGWLGIPLYVFVIIGVIVAFFILILFPWEKMWLWLKKQFCTIIEKCSWIKK